MNVAATRRTGVAWLLVLLIAAPVEAQRRGTPAPGRETALLVGGSRLDTGDLNDRLAAAGYPTFDQQYLAIGIVTSRPLGDLRIGFEAAGLMRPGTATADNRWRVDTGGGYAMLNLGHTVFREGGLAVTPKAGLGAGAVTLRITDRDAPGFDDVLAEPGRGVHLSTASLLLDGSLGIRYRTGGRAARRAFMVGVRGGYMQSLLHGEWRRGQRDAPGGPTAGWGGPHFEVLLGRSVR